MKLSAIFVIFCSSHVVHHKKEVQKVKSFCFYMIEKRPKLAKIFCLDDITRMTSS